MKLQPQELSKQVFVYGGTIYDDFDEFVLEQFMPLIGCESCCDEDPIGAYIISNDPNSFGLCAKHLRSTYEVILNVGETIIAE